jgi:hypothetical protein
MVTKYTKCKIKNDYRIYQLTTKYIHQLASNIPNGCKYTNWPYKYQMVIIYTKIYQIYRNWDANLAIRGLWDRRSNFLP